ncbi:unnamed protein product [Paramecium primaurelia]|uniref:Uncharacterized protein n=1 Tax=Paramecium primaurelia TaxID=5886 RepID=A0A8S1K1E3_PARPR|nr:unnamed protein product [Paramecium primaurelia]
MDLHKFQHFILELDFNKILEQSKINQLEVPKDEQIESDFLCKVPISFGDENEYQKIWKPLFYEEVKANIVKSFQTETYPDVEYKFEKHKKDEFTKLDFQLIGQKDQLNFRDLVLISCTPYQQGDQCLLGLIENNQDIVRVNVQNNFEPIGALFEKNMIINQQNPNQKSLKNFFIRKVTGLSTLEREFRALHKFGDLMLKSILLSLDTQPKVNSYFTIPYKLDQKLHSIYNSSQYEAIQQTLKTHGITLIQGPPGTGKTKTVLGTLSVLLQSKQERPDLNLVQKTSLEVEQEYNQEFPQPWKSSNYDDWRDHIFDDVEQDISNYFTNRLSDFQKEKPTPIYKSDYSQAKIPNKILVCGPSNASVDEIIRKVLEEGLLDENGQRSDVPIVRIGENFDPTLSKVSLECLVQQRIYEQQNQDTDKVKKEILNQAKVIFGTLSSSGSNVLAQSELKFDTVIIDEAAQAVEISTLIPLQYGCRRLILIGDPNQLPATIFSSICGKYKYDQSLFERLQKQGANVHLLKTQYRMHAKISKFISTTFYGSELNDYEHLERLIGTPKFYDYYTYSPVVILHVKGYENFTRNSYCNEMEAKVVSELYKDMKNKFPNFNMNNLGIVSPYSQQVWLINKQLKKLNEDNVEVKTVDGFQGREKDVIIFSSVRSKFISENVKNPKKGVGFLSDARRMNVSLSRCRQSLIVVCDIYKISCNERWRSLINYSIQLGSCYRVETEDISEWFQSFDQDPLRYSIINEITFKKKVKPELVKT